MLGDNIKKLRVQKGYSQEILADQLHVVRQTISKWEKGISVPDAVMLNKIAEHFDVSVNELLGGDIAIATEGSEENKQLNEIAKQLAVLNEQLVTQTVRRRKAAKRIIEAGGDAWIANRVQTENYSDANILMAQIEDYFETRGGTCVITEQTSNDW